MNKNTKDFLKAFNAELGDKLDGGMPFASTEFFEWMRDQYAPYEAAIEKDVRGMGRDEFKAKWLEKRMGVKDSFLPNEDSNSTNKSLNDGKRTIVWVIDEMLADFDCIVDDAANGDNDFDSDVLIEMGR